MTFSVGVAMSSPCWPGSTSGMASQMSGHSSCGAGIAAEVYSQGPVKSSALNRPSMLLEPLHDWHAVSTRHLPALRNATLGSRKPFDTGMPDGLKPGLSTGLFALFDHRIRSESLSSAGCASATVALGQPLALFPLPRHEYSAAGVPLTMVTLPVMTARSSYGVSGLSMARLGVDDTICQCARSRLT